MALSLYLPCLRLLLTIANLHQYTDRAMMITGLLPVIGPAWLRQGTWGRGKKKVHMSCRISQEKRETRLQIIEGCRSTNEREA